jgi:phosphatidylserine/phosphatidylglycerophosphate/cardiolipin synthase-like enzyme
MKKLMTLSLFLMASLVVEARPKTFLSELGDFEYEKVEIQNYFSEQEINYFFLKDSFVDTTYKINFRNQFQIKDWFGHDWHELQKNYSFDYDKYLSYYKANSLNEAKQNYYSTLAFNQKKMFHEEELVFFKEWGGLNHPPIHNDNKLNDLTKYAAHYKNINYDEVESKHFEPSFQENIDNITDSELSFNNTLEVLEDDEAYLRKMELIKSAKSSILMSTLVFVCDSTTKALVIELSKKAKAGIPVYVLQDNLIATLLGHKECPNMLKDAGVKFISAKDAFNYEGNAIYHNKKLIVDLKEAIVGGHNMLNADNASKGTDFKNRDIDLYAKGPVVSDIAKGFIEDYEHFYKERLKHYKKRASQIHGKRSLKTSFNKRRLKKWLPYKIDKLSAELKKLISTEKQNKLRGKELYSNILNNKKTRMNGVCRFIGQSPYKDGTSIGKAYLEYLDITDSYLGIMTPELLDTKYTSFKDRPLIEKFDEFGMYNKLHDKLQVIGNQEGMQVDLLTSGPEVAGNEAVTINNEKIREYLKNGKVRSANFRHQLNNFWNNYYGRPHFDHLVKDYVPLKNVDTWMHLSFIHSKVFYFDRIAASIGSYNFHHNATDHAYENTIVCQDKKLNAELNEVFVRDMANSVPLVYRKLVK